MEANKTILQMKYARIVPIFAEQTGITLEDALNFFYTSSIYQMMNEGIADMHCRSDGYLANLVKEEWKNKKSLAKLADYAEQFSTGKILYKRFSPSEQLGCVKGGTIHVIASLLAGAEVGTDQLSAPEGSFKRELQLAKIQEKRISHN